MVVSTLSRPKAAATAYQLVYTLTAVSTLSRPKAADGYTLVYIYKRGFNTQPPEGG